MFTAVLFPVPKKLPKMDKCTVVYSYNGILHSNENEQTAHKNMDMLGQKPGTEKKYCIIPFV